MLTLLYQDEDLAIISKPAGLLVHRTDIDYHETENALKQLNRQLGRHVYATHRLDKATSGALVFALNKPAAKAVNLAFDNRQVKKIYIGITRGYTDVSGLIDYPLKKTTPGNATDAAVNQEAVTNYERLATAELPVAVGRYPTARYSLIKLQPVTGRRHQLRRHMKHIFHPLIGDTTYGDGKHNTFFREHFDCHRLLLHSYALSFPHPVSGKPVSATAPLDSQFQQLMTEFGWINALPVPQKNSGNRGLFEVDIKKN